METTRSAGTDVGDRIAAESRLGDGGRGAPAVSGVAIRQVEDARPTVAMIVADALQHPLRVIGPERRETASLA
jgi:hypothetical protein